MEVKILCPCGAKYKFDVEPLHGKLPGPVKCPVCSLDGTAAGDAIIAQQLAASVLTPPPAPAIPQPAAPAPSGIVIPVVPRSSRAAAAAPPPPAAPAASVHVVSAPPPPPPAPAVRPVSVVPGTASALSVASVAPHQVAAPPPAPVAAPQNFHPPSSGPSVGLGVIGAVAAGVIGTLAWYLITLSIHKKLGLLAIFVGAFIGWAAKFLARGPSSALGFTAAIVAFVAILGGGFFADRHETNTYVNDLLKELYNARVAYAKEAVAAKTDEELKEIIATQSLADAIESGDDDLLILDPDQIDATRLAKFKTTELPQLKNLADGKVSRTSFEIKERPKIEADLGGPDVGFWISTAIFLFFGVGAAWQLAAGRS